LRLSHGARKFTAYDYRRSTVARKQQKQQAKQKKPHPRFPERSDEAKFPPLNIDATNPDAQTNAAGGGRGRRGAFFSIASFGVF